ncbi:MAG: c-type cytochrome [Bacteriovorax sp.]|nr:c-type cytochrome [Rhizobacter sp.]
MPWRHTAAAVALLLLGSAVVLPAGAQSKKAAAAGSAAPAATPAGATALTASGHAIYAERFRNVCAACHGAEGRSDMVGTPVLAGQYSLYAITQLFLFREGRRTNEAMVALAKQMTDTDLRGFSDFIGTLAPIPAPPPAVLPDAARMSKGLAIAQQHKCLFCHGAALDGGQGVPRIGGQKEEYLRSTLHGLKSGERPGYTRAMTEALSQVPVEELDLLAYYVANFTDK